MKSEAHWDKTIFSKERLRGKDFFEEPSGESRHGSWRGRDIIGRDSPINGGVYVGAGEREAIVVDDEKQQKLVDAYQELLDRRHAKEKSGQSFKSGVL